MNPTVTFQQASAAFQSAPTSDTLLVMAQAALQMLPAKNQPRPVTYFPAFPKHEWIAVTHPDAFSIDISEIRLTIDRYLSSDEVSRASGCLGYALRQELAGEDLSDPYIIQSRRAGQTILLFSYDGTKSRRDDPDYAAAFALAEQYIQAGSPIRSSNRAGVGTKNTRLVTGIGSCDIQFAIR